MMDVRTFFQLNREIILFIYGLAFFVLGLAIALQSRQHSRLEIARSLPWLAGFGLTHGLHEWGDFFIPIQSTYLSEPVITILIGIQLVLLAVSFACLMQFGISMLDLKPENLPRVLTLAGGSWLRGTAVAMLVIWLLLIFLVLIPLAPDLQTWRREANALARYFIGFPGALLAAYALRQQALYRIAPLNAPHVVNNLRIAGGALALYAIVSGLIPPPIPFFPGNWLNAQTIIAITGAPPSVFRSIIGLVLAVSVIRALDIFELETQHFIETMEQQQILATERERIARELHDGVIQKVYTAGLLVQAASKQAPPDTTLSNRLRQVLDALEDASRDLRRNLGELHPAPLELELSEALRELSCDPRFRTLVEVTLDLELSKDESLSAARTHDVIAIVQESLSNVVRHARARHVRIAAHQADGRLHLTVQDDGVGLPRSLVAGYGLRNMRDRAHLLGGEIEISGANGKGTTVALDVPWKDER